MADNDVLAFDSSNDAAQVTTDQNKESGEIQANVYNFWIRPSERHLWSSLVAMWIKQDTIPEEERPDAWALYKYVSLAITKVDSVIIPDEYIIKEVDPFTLKYGEEEDTPETPANAETTITHNPASAGTVEEMMCNLRS